MSVVVPAYDEADNLVELIPQIHAACAAAVHEIIVVDDGSTDHTAAVLREMATRYPSLRACSLRRNMGKSMALAVGFEQARYPVVVTIDADMQDDPADIPRLVARLGNDYDLVSGQRSRRNDGFLRGAVSWLFNFIVRRLTGLRFRDLNCGLKAYRSEVVKTVPVYGQFHRYIPLLAHLTGFKVTELPVANNPRKHGQSKYRTFRYEGIWDLFSILFTYNYRFRPLHFFAKLALLFIIPSSLILAYLVGGYVVWLFVGGEYPSLFSRPLLSMSLTMFVVGTVVFVSGFVCDFILHHTISANMRHVSTASVREMIGADAGDGSEKPPADAG